MVPRHPGDADIATIIDILANCSERSPSELARDYHRSVPFSLHRSETIEPDRMPNSTRSANEAMSFIARRIAERAAAINLAAPDEIGPMCQMVTTFLDQMMAGISGTEASRLLYRMIDRIDLLGDNLLQSVNPSAQRTAFQDHIGQVLARFANGRSAHLELGVWTTWPEERVQRHVGPDKLGDIIRLDMNPTFPVDVAASVTALPFRDPGYSM